MQNLQCYAQCKNFEGEFVNSPNFTSLCSTKTLSFILSSPHFNVYFYISTTVNFIYVS